MNRSRLTLILSTFGLLLLVGLGDYLTGYEVSFLIFYLLPVALAAWYRRPGFRSVRFVSQRGGLALHRPGLGRGVPEHHRARVERHHRAGLFPRRRVAAEQPARSPSGTRNPRPPAHGRAHRGNDRGANAWKKTVLEISEREQRRIGHDLHDGLGQHLTGTALAGQVLADRLAAHDLPEAADAERIVGLLEDAIELTRSLSRGLSPVALDADGLTNALTELAAQTTGQFYLPCTFRSDASVHLADPTAATHLYRIAQEAVGIRLHPPWPSQPHRHRPHRWSARLRDAHDPRRWRGSAAAAHPAWCRTGPKNHGPSRPNDRRGP